MPIVFIIHGSGFATSSVLLQPATIESISQLIVAEGHTLVPDAVRKLCADSFVVENHDELAKLVKSPAISSRASNKSPLKRPPRASPSERRSNDTPASSPQQAGQNAGIPHSGECGYPRI